MGTTVALNYVIDFHPSLTGLITSGATLAPVPDIPPILVSLSGILGALLPHLPTIRLDSNALSHDPGVGEAYRNDPLVFSGGMPARTGAEINKTFAYLQPRLNQIETPLLILHGTGDRLVDPASSRFLADLAASEDKTLKLYDGLFHEIFNEPEKDQVFQDIIAWITDRL
jgi:alpha-beta hydrolase superfamily lysophospholipase